jgi:hypothetical protein
MIWQRQHCKTLTISDGETASNVVDFHHNYKVFGVACRNAVGIPNAAILSARVDWGCGELVTLYQQDDPETIWGPAPPGDNESFGFILTHAFGARRLQFYLDVAVTEDVSFDVIGLDQGDEYQ